MNDQSFLHSVDDENSDAPQKVNPDADQAMNGLVRKRFRRGVARRATRNDVVAQAPATGLAPFVTNDPIVDEWDSLPFALPAVRHHFLSGSPLVNFFRRDPAAKAFDLLRTRLLQALRSNGWSRIAIASPTQGCGATFTAVNLAQSLARIPGSRTVLMDLNHRTPAIATRLGMNEPGDMRGFLAGEVPLQQHLQRVSGTLALGVTSGPVHDAAEILHDNRCGETLDHMMACLRPGVAIYDLPPILAHDDLAAFLPQVDGVLLVTDGTQTQARHIAACERALEGQTPVLGIILNRARNTGSQEFEF